MEPVVRLRHMLIVSAADIQSLPAGLAIEKLSSL